MDKYFNYQKNEEELNSQELYEKLFHNKEKEKEKEINVDSTGEEMGKIIANKVLNYVIKELELQ